MASSQPSIQPNVMTSAENKGSGVATSIAMPSPPEPSSGTSMQVSSDKNRRLANTAPEARLQTKQMHTRVPAWKLPLCIQALNARPIDLAHVAEVTEILFASSDLVIVAAKCLADLARESNLDESINQSAEGTDATQSLHQVQLEGRP